MNGKKWLYMLGTTVFGFCLAVMIMGLVIVSYEPASVNEPVKIVDTTVLETETPKPTSTHHSTRTPRPTRTPVPTTTPEIGSIRNPVPFGTQMFLVQNEFVEFSVLISGITRGVDAWTKIYNANMFNEPAPEGMEYIIAEIYISHYGNDEEILELSYFDWSIVSNSRYFDEFDTGICCVSPELDVKLGSGGDAFGLIVRPVFLNDENPLLVLGDKFYFSTK